MRMYDIISHKRDGLALTDEEIHFFVRQYTDGNISDCQASSLMMAIYLNGMNKNETAVFTMEMAKSGDMLDLSEIDGITVDKHSTGGVGDKTTLIVIPIVASLGAKAAKMSGRGLGHTGGTIDKLESIKGFDTALSPEDFIKQAQEVGAVVVGQTGHLAPADKKIYKLRDETATVGSIPLIASSIMSKKLAAGSKCIVLDVKTGSGAFMKTEEKAKELAKTMVDIGNSAGRKVAALITDMDTPLGTHIGNALEVKEAVAVLKGQIKNDLYDVSIELAATIISLSFGYLHDEAVEKCKRAIESGSAFNKFLEMVNAQHGDVESIKDTSLLPSAVTVYDVKSKCDGYVSRMDAEKIGVAALLLGAGRAGDIKEKIDMSAGIILNKKTGDFVKKGEILAQLHTSTCDITDAEMKLLEAYEFSNEKPQQKPLIYDIIY